MKHFKILDLDQFKDSARYEAIEAGIYQDTEGGVASHRLAMAMELEENEDSQYPLEDILDRYLVHVEGFLSTDETCQEYIFGGNLEGLQQLKSLVGKRVYYQEFDAGGGEKRSKLVIE